MESQNQNPEKFHPCSWDAYLSLKFIKKLWAFFYIQGHTFIIFYLMILFLIMSLIVMTL